MPFTSSEIPNNHFDGGKNLTQGSKTGGGPTLAELQQDVLDRVAGSESAMHDPVTTVADLRAVEDYADQMTIFCEAKGEYYYEATSAAVDDGDLIVQPTAVAGNGRWLLMNRLDAGRYPTRVIYVDGTSGDDTFAGTVKEPLATIQAGIDAAGALAPTIAAPVMVAIYSDTYTEDLSIHGDIDFSGLILWAVGGKVMVEAATNSALIVSNSTLASIALYRAAGADPTPGTGDLALLVAGASPATEITLHNIIFGAVGSVVVDAQVVGVGAGVAFGTTAITFLECGINGDLITENVVTVQVVNGCVIGQDLRFWNTNQINFLRSNIVRNVTGSWDTAQNVPSVVTNLGLINGYGGFIGGNLTFDGGATAVDGVNDPGNGVIRGLNLVGNIDIDDQATLFMENCDIGGSGDVEGDAVLTFVGVDMIGALVMVNAGGAVACTFDAGSLLGALTDAGARLAITGNIAGQTTIGGVATRTLGNLPVFTRQLAIPFGDASTAGTTIALSFASALPASAMPIGGRINVATNYDDAGGTITACTAQLGTTANPDLLLDAGNDILAGTGDLAAAGDAFDGTLAMFPRGAITPVVTITSTGANLSTLTTGAITAYLYFVIPQV